MVGDESPGHTEATAKLDRPVELPGRKPPHDEHVVATRRARAHGVAVMGAIMRAGANAPHPHPQHTEARDHRSRASSGVTPYRVSWHTTNRALRGFGTTLPNHKTATRFR